MDEQRLFATGTNPANSPENDAMDAAMQAEIDAGLRKFGEPRPKAAPAGWREDRSALRDGMIVQIRSRKSLGGWTATARRVGNPEDEDEGRFPARFWQILHYNGDVLVPVFYGTGDLEWQPLASPLPDSAKGGE